MVGGPGVSNPLGDGLGLLKSHRVEERGQRLLIPGTLPRVPGCLGNLLLLLRPIRSLRLLLQLMLLLGSIQLRQNRDGRQWGGMLR
jgi:hypothetical protein